MFQFRSPVHILLAIASLLAPIVVCAGAAAQLVPVAPKRALSWGQSGGLGGQQPDDQSFEQELEELPAPMDPIPYGLTAAGTSPQELADSEPGMAPDESERAFYEGRATEIIRQRYPDGRVQVERYVAQDEQGNFLNHGPWTLFGRRGEVLARGQFLDGQMSGNWFRWHAANGEGMLGEPPFTSFRGPFLSSCDFREGQPDGVWTILDAQRRKILEIPYRSGKRHGVVTWYWPEGRRMRQVQFTDGQLDGEQIEWDRFERVTRRASWDRNRELITRSGWFWRDQQQFEEHWLGAEVRFLGNDDWWNAAPAPFEVEGEEVQHGVTSEWYRNGQLKMRGMYRNGQREETFSWWHENGQRQTTGSYREGLKQGQWNWWHTNGSLAVTGSYENDAPVGQWSWYHENGQLERSEIMDGRQELEELDSLDAAHESIDGLESPAGSASPANSQPAATPSAPTATPPLEEDFGFGIPDSLRGGPP